MWEKCAIFPEQKIDELWTDVDVDFCTEPSDPKFTGAPGVKVDRDADASAMGFFQLSLYNGMLCIAVY